MEFPKNSPLKKLEELARQAKERGFGVKEKEYDPQLLEFLKKKYNPFLNHCYRESRDVDQDFKPTFKVPQDINWKELPHTKGESSEYYINPEMPYIEFQKLKPAILNEPKWKEMTLPAIMSEVVKDYQDTHYIPGVEYLKWLLENPKSIPEEMKTGELFYFPGSLYTRKDGSWYGKNISHCTK
jgi:hypothetical protein